MRVDPLTLGVWLAAAADTLSCEPGNTLPPFIIFCFYSWKSNDGSNSNSLNLKIQIQVQNILYARSLVHSLYWSVNTASHSLCVVSSCVVQTAHAPALSRLLWTRFIWQDSSLAVLYFPGASVSPAFHPLTPSQELAHIFFDNCTQLDQGCHWYFPFLLHRFNYFVSVCCII